MTQPAPIHVCLNADHCQPGNDPNPTEAPNTLCQHCTHRARRHIEHLPVQHLRLHAMLGDHTPAINGRHQQPASSVPLNTTIDTLLTDIHYQATLAAEIVADALNTANPYHHHPSNHVCACCRLVAPNMPILLRLTDIPIMEFGAGRHRHLITTTTGTAIVQQLDHLANLAHHHLGQTRARTYRDLPCARCAANTVGRWAGASSYDCTTCGAVWPEADIRRLDRILLERHRRGLIHA